MISLKYNINFKKHINNFYLWLISNILDKMENLFIYIILKIEDEVQPICRKQRKQYSD